MEIKVSDPGDGRIFAFVPGKARIGFDNDRLFNESFRRQLLESYGLEPCENLRFEPYGHSYYVKCVWAE